MSVSTFFTPTRPRILWTLAAILLLTGLNHLVVALITCVNLGGENASWCQPLAPSLIVFLPFLYLLECPLLIHVPLVSLFGFGVVEETISLLFVLFWIYCLVCCVECCVMEVREKLPAKKAKRAVRVTRKKTVRKSTSKKK